MLWPKKNKDMDENYVYAAFITEDLVNYFKIWGPDQWLTSRHSHRPRPSRSFHFLGTQCDFSTFPAQYPKSLAEDELK